MLEKNHLINLLRNEPHHQFDIDIEDLNGAGIDWVEVSELSLRSAYVKKKLIKSSNGGLAMCDARVVFLRKPEAV
jgi:hypothetical protein